VPDSSEAPDIDPVLSKGALKINPKKLRKVPWNHSGDHPGSDLAWPLMRSAASLSKYYIFRSIEEQEPVNDEGGRIYASMHINGLIDPLAIITSQTKRTITMGRHDLATMPLIGWFTRRLGNQPIIRKVERDKGVTDSEFAEMINHRSLLTMAHCISGGYAAVVMPEGKSHQDSRLHKLRTGPMRFAINASEIARSRGVIQPKIQPVGLHFRCHHWFRTDLFVEYPEPIEIPLLETPEHSNNLLEGTWVEPPETLVRALTKKLEHGLSEASPQAKDWETYRAWHILAHIESRNLNHSLNSYSEEVIHSRKFRNHPTIIEGSKILNDAKMASSILHSRQLDGRSLSDSMGIKQKSELLKGVLGVAVMLLATPLSLISTGLQATLAWYLGNNSDEGIDARTTHHFLGIFLSIMTIWPILSIFTTAYILGLTSIEINVFTLVIGSSIAFVAFQLSNFTFLLGYDLWNDFSVSLRRRKLARTTEGKQLIKLVKGIASELVALK
tara:strand:- start:7584 stop:9080 length:1497 start_codon:yes stop_codon:yes gene_type:complete